jgi:hypothetical protein
MFPLWSEFLNLPFVRPCVKQKVPSKKSKNLSFTPDCEAMRLVGPENEQPALIEFELESRNFLLHEHNVKECDIIVRWKHNWEDCPLEVIELSKELQRWRERGESRP